MKLGVEVGLGPATLCYMKTWLPQPPIFGPCLLWSNSWMIRIPLGMEVGLNPGNIVLVGDPAAPKRGTAPNFWPNGWMD